MDIRMGLGLNTSALSFSQNIFSSGNESPPQNTDIQSRSLSISGMSLNIFSEISAQQNEDGVSISQNLNISLSSFSYTQQMSSGSLVTSMANRMGQFQNSLKGNSRNLFGAVGSRLLGRSTLSQGASLALTGMYMRQTEKLAAMGSSEVQKYLLVVHSLMGKDSKEAERFIRQLDKILSTSGDDEAMRFIDETASRLNILNTSAQVGQVERRLEDGTVLEISVNAGVTQVSMREEVQQVDPIIFDLDGDGVELTGLDEGVEFDMLADGTPVKTSFVKDDDAFLVLDRNSNGKIDDGSELFGTQNGAENGFEELRKYDDNEDGVINSEDMVYDRLGLWRDLNLDGVSQLHEIKSLEYYNIEEIALKYKDENFYTRHEDILAQHSNYIRSDDSTGYAADALLNYINIFKY